MQEPFNFVFNFVFVWINTAALHVSVHDLHACLYTPARMCVHICVCVCVGRPHHISS